MTNTKITTIKEVAFIIRLLLDVSNAECIIKLIIYLINIRIIQVKSNLVKTIFPQEKAHILYVPFLLKI